MRRTAVISCGVSVLLTSAASALVVVPNSAAGVEADGTFALTSTATAGRTFQLTIAENQLTGLAGLQLTGLQFRLNGAAAAAWPAVETSWASWDVYVGPGVAPALMSNTFALNFSGPATQVRSGPFTVSPNSFSAGAAPNAFGPTLDFTSPYLYSGGDLTVEMRFSQQVGATNQPSLDAVLASGGPGNGWGVDFAARWTGNAAGISGSNGNFLVTNFLAVPAPSALALLGLSMGVAARRTRRA